MDSSTYFRSHPIEILFWFGTSNIIAAGIFGLDLLTLSLYYVIATPFFVIEHVNLKFPVWLDKTLGWVITTPNLHKVHHEQDVNFTNSNYADVFIIWDRLFGTYKYKPVEKINLGLKEFDHPKKQTFWYLLKSPFIDIYKSPSSNQLK
jgi:sterol desaturase/sphingolipid hydroxylase (fatty acid hydroxylase superfamily)